MEQNKSDKSPLITLVLACIGFVGCAGLHRFFVGKVGTGILYLFTFGVFGIGTIIDVINIARGVFKDAEGKPISDWTND